MSPDSGGYRVDQYTTERLDDVNTRLARLEGERVHMATKDDVTSAKLQLVLAWVGAGIALLSAVGMIVARIVLG